MDIRLKSNKPEEVLIGNLSIGTIFRFTKPNHILLDSLTTGNIWMLVEVDGETIKIAQLSGDYAVVKRSGPMFGYKINASVIVEASGKLTSLQELQIGTTVILRTGINDYSYSCLIVKDPTKPREIALLQLKDGELTYHHSEAMCKPVPCSVEINTSSI